MGIELTERAARKISRIFSRHNVNEGLYLRVGVTSGGCSDYSYRLDVTDTPDMNDAVFESRGIRVVCDAGSFPYLDGAKLDYNDDLLKGGFVFDNPNLRGGQCSCGGACGD